MSQGLRLDLDLRWTARWAALLLVALASGAVLTNQWGWYVADARFEHFWGAQDFLSAHRYAWDGVRTLGTPAPYFSPVVGAVLAAFDAVGASPALAQRLLHVAYLLVAGAGMVQVMRLFRPRLATEHVLAAAIYMFNPFTAQFLLPSGLFLHYAVAPWLVVATARGLREDDGWRWSALFALALFVLGALNGAALAYALTPAAVTALYVVLVERAASLRRLAGWGARTALLVGVVTSAALVQMALNSAAVAENLNSTEVPTTISRTSSWSESWRGLGFWLTYFPTSTGLLRPNATPYFSEAAVTAATFALPVAALVSAWLHRWRARLLFLGMTAVALVLMVGIHPVAGPPPWGDLLAEGFDRSVFLRGFRTGYKAGAGWAMGVAALAAVGVVAAVRGAARHRRRALPVATALGAVAAVTLASFPFWTGRLYPERDRTRALPSYWHDALAWLDDQPGEGRVLVLPGTNRARYRWGYVGDDIFDALLDRPHAMRSSLSQGTAEAADVLSALDDWVASRAYEPGTLAPVARRLGVRWVVVRNDLAWQRAGLPRPADFDALRRDGDLLRVADFGKPGLHTADPDDPTAALFGEARLAPVEVFAVRGARTAARLVPSTESLLLSGNGEGWLSAAAGSLLHGDATVRYSADLSLREMRALVGRVPVLVTDTNRRRTKQITTDRNYRSHTLAEGETLRRSPPRLFERPGSEAVATFGAARRVTATAYGEGLHPFPTWLRPAQAVDGDEGTAWQVGGVHPPVGQRLRIELRRPTPIPAVTVLPTDGETTVSEITLHLDGGRRLTSPLDGDGPTRVKVGGGPVRSVEVEISGVEGATGGLTGLAEVDLGVDVSERIRTPVDVALAARADPALEAALAEADVGHSFRRVVGSGPQPDETRLRRSFATVGSRDYRLTGTVRLHRETDDDAIAALFRRRVRATASGRVGGITNRALNVLDGDLATAWETRAEPGQAVDVTLPRQRLDFVDVTTVTDRGAVPRWSRIESVAVRLGDSPVARVTALPADRPCDPFSPPGVCAQRYRIPVPRGRTSKVTVEVGRLTRVPGAFGPRPVRVAEVRPGLRGRLAFEPVTAELPTGCVPLVAVDGERVAVRFADTAAALFAGRPVPFEACRSVTLEGGGHTLDSLSRSHRVVDRVRLSAGDLTPDSARRAGGSVEVVERGRTHLRFTVHAPQGGVFVPGVAFHRGWRASANGKSLGRPRPADTMAAWALPPGSFDVEVEFEPQRTYETALAASAGGVVMCLWLLVRRRGQP